MRQIKVGDTVQAFWDANLIGEVVSLGFEKNNTHLVGGTAEPTPFCDVKVKTGNIVRVKVSDVFHVV